MELRWRPGANRQLPDALARMPIEDTPGVDVDDSFPDESSTRTTYGYPRGPVLDGVLLSELGIDEVDTYVGKDAVVVASVIFAPGGAAVGDDHSQIAAGAEVACAIEPTAGGSAAGANDVMLGRRVPVKTRGFARRTVRFVRKRPGALAGDAGRHQI